MLRIPLLAIAAGVAIGFIAPAFLPEFQSRSEAGTAVQLDLDEAFLASDLVVEGLVTAARSGELGDGTIYTDWDLRVERTFWGEEAETRTIRLPGGMLATGRGMLIPGMPRLVEGEHVVLLLEEPHRDGLRLTTGLSQGKYRIVTSSRGESVAVRTGDHVSLITARNTRVADRNGMLGYADLVARLEAARQERIAAAPAPR